MGIVFSRKKPYIRLTRRTFRFIKTFFCLLLVLLVFIWIRGISTKIINPGKTIDFVSVPVLTPAENKALKKYPNAIHLEIAKVHGISPLKSQEEFNKEKQKYINQYVLLQIKDNKYYEVPRLIHSIDYLKSPAKKFLNDLGKSFQQRLTEMGLRKYRFSITSVLRTTDDQKGLRKSNVNATPNNSSHYYGLTFDLSQTRFFESGNSNPVYSYRLRNILLRELIRMQEEGRCYVLLEQQTKCIHVTVIPR